MHGSPTSCDGAAGVRLPLLRVSLPPSLSLVLCPSRRSSLCTNPENASRKKIRRNPFSGRLIDHGPFHLAQPFPDSRKIWSGGSFEGLCVFHATSKRESIKAISYGYAGVHLLSNHRYFLTHGSLPPGGACVL